MGRTLKSVILGSACAMALVTAALAQAGTVDVPAGDLRAAIDKYAQQSGLQIVYRPDDLSGLKTPGVHGSLTPDQAVHQLLAGTGLVANQEPGGAIGIGKGDQPKNAQAASNEEAATPIGLNIETVVVTGTNIRGEAPIGEHLIEFDRPQIEQSGYGRLQDFLATMPQNFGGNTETNNQNTSGNPNITYGAEVQVHGLGTGTTLTLVDGMRQPSGGTQGAMVDISAIPMVAVERVEVLPDGASALYGSDAVGGVVNVILRKDFDGFETQARYGVSSGGEAAETDLSAVWGTHWDTGHVVLGYQYTNRAALTFGSRAYTATNGNFTAFGGTNLAQVGGNPGEILDASRKPAFAIPAGQNGVGLTVSELLPGVVNYANESYADLTPSVLANSVFFAASQQVGDRLELFADVRYNVRDNVLLTARVPTKVSVPHTNPFYVNPFGGTGAVTVDYDFTDDLGAQTFKAANDSLAAVAGGTLKLGTDWQLKISGSFGQSNNLFSALNFANAAARTAALADSNPLTALNVFGDGSNTNSATIAAIRSAPLSENGISTIWSAGATADGSLFDLPAGPAKAAIGAEFRDENLHGTSSYESYSVRANRTDAAVFAELAVPLVSDVNAFPGAKKVDLSIAGRLDKYSDVGSAWNPKVGLGWTVTDDFAIRSSWGTSFRAPPFDLSVPGLQPSFVESGVYVDPMSPTGSSQVLQTGSPATNLKPETATTWTIGSDWKPIADARVSLSYFDIDYSNRIAGPPDSGTLLVNEARYIGTDVIIRNPTPAQETAACNAPGAVVTADCTQSYAAIVNLGVRNLASELVRGLDADLSYGIDAGIGRISVDVAGTYYLRYQEATLPGSTPFNIANTISNPLKFRMRDIINWEYGDWFANGAINFANGYHNATATGTMPVDSWTTFDLGIGYRLPESMWGMSKTRLMINATNLFDTLPPFVNQTTGYDGSNANMLQRTISVQLIADW